MEYWSGIGMLNNARISVREITEASCQTRLHEFITAFLSEGGGRLEEEGEGGRWEGGRR